MVPLVVAGAVLLAAVLFLGYTRLLASPSTGELYVEAAAAPGAPVALTAPIEVSLELGGTGRAPVHAALGSTPVVVFPFFPQTVPLGEAQVVAGSYERVAVTLGGAKVRQSRQFTLAFQIRPGEITVLVFHLQPKPAGGALPTVQYVTATHPAPG